MYVTHQVVLLAVDLAVDVVEGLAAQRAAAAAADEAVGVVQVAHRLARVARTSHLLAARETLTCQHDVTFTNLVVTDVKKDQADEGKQRKNGTALRYVTTRTHMHIMLSVYTCTCT